MPATPRDAAQDVLDRAIALLSLDQAPAVPLVRQDVRRASLAMGVSAIDTYLHWAVRKTPLSNLPAKLAKLTVTFGELIEMGVASRREV